MSDRPGPNKGDRPLILKPADWPAGDHVAWNALFVEGDILDGAGPCAHWAEGSRIKRRQSYGYWLAFLGRRGELEEHVDVAGRATPDRVQAFVEGELVRCSPVTVHSQVADLYALLRAMAPHRDWSWLAAMSERLRILSRNLDLKPRAGVSAREILAWGHERMASAADLRRVADPWRGMTFRDGLMIGLLVARPLRVRTFIAIKINHHLLPHPEGFLLRFAPEDMKDRRARDYLLPADLVVPMQTYLTVHRPALLQGHDSDRLWVSRRGTPFGIDSFTSHLANLTRRAFGETLRPHAFRHIAATSIAADDPDNANIIAPVLGHASLRMSEKHYNRARGVEAASAYQDLVAGVRTEARRRSRNRNRTNRSAHRASRSQSDMGN